MSKELEALEKIKIGFGCDMAYYSLNLEYEIVEQALHRLEAIDNSKPSEALERLEKNRNAIPYTIDYRTIKQALIKAQENEKVLEIIKEIITTTEDRLQDILRCKDYEEYKGLWYWERELTEEEFNLLKRWNGNV